MPRQWRVPQWRWSLRHLKGQGHQRALLDFLSRRPGSEDADAKPEFHQLLGGFDAAQLHYAVEHHLLAPEVILDQPKSDALLAVQDVVPPRQLRPVNPPGLSPGMQGADDKVQLIGEQWMTFELRLFLGGE